MLAEARKKLLRQRDGGIGHGHRADPYLGICADFLGDRKCVLNHTCQLLADGIRCLGIAIGIFKLAQNLRFAQHHRVEPARDAENVTDGVVAFQLEQRLAEGRIQVLRVVQPFEQMLMAAVVGYYIKLGAVAGGQ